LAPDVASTLAALGVGQLLAAPPLDLAGWVLVAHVGGDRLAG